jgi:hypothetical protein
MTNALTQGAYQTPLSRGRITARYRAFGPPTQLPELNCWSNRTETNLTDLVSNSSPTGTELVPNQCRTSSLLAPALPISFSALILTEEEAQDQALPRRTRPTAIGPAHSSPRPCASACARCAACRNTIESLCKTVRHREGQSNGETADPWRVRSWIAEAGAADDLPAIHRHRPLSCRSCHHRNIP